MRRFDYYAPESLSEAVAVLKQRGPGGRVLAGGTDLVVKMREAGLHPEYVVSLRRLAELRGVSHSAQEGLRIGAASTMREVHTHPDVLVHYPAIADAAGLVGSVQTRNMATVGGNICNAAPSADTAPALIAMSAQAVIAGPGGTRTVPLEQLFLGPSLTVLGDDEILVELRVPPQAPRSGGAYLRHTPRKEMDIAVVGVGAYLELGEDGRTCRRARVVLGAVAPTPLVAQRTEQALAGQVLTEEALEGAAAVAREEARPISDQRGSAEYRRRLTQVLTKRCLERALARAQGR